MKRHGAFGPILPYALLVTFYGCCSSCNSNDRSRLSIVMSLRPFRFKGLPKAENFLSVDRISCDMPLFVAVNAMQLVILPGRLVRAAEFDT